MRPRETYPLGLAGDHTMAAKRGRKPTSKPDLSDPVLGRLRYDKDVKWYEGVFAVGGSSISFNLEVNEQGDVAPALNRARQVLGDLERHARGARDYAVEQLLDLKNESWLDEDEEPVTAEQFQARMELRGLVFSRNGEVTFYHRDGDLFYGHSIQIAMDAADRFIDADIPG